MGLPSGTFSSSYAGRLVVTLSCKFFASSYVDAGFPNSGNGRVSNLSLIGYAGPGGSPSYSAIVDKYNLISSFELDYPGAGAAWPVGVQEVGHVNPTGIYSYGMNQIVLSCKLRKR